MKKIFIYIAIFFLGITGCEDVLDKENLNVIDDDLWNIQTEAESYINELYRENIPEMSLGEYAGYSDEGFTTSQDVTDYMYGLIDSTEVATSSLLDRSHYQLIRSINIGIEGLTTSTLDVEEKNELLGQAYFLRAWRYWDLVRLHGGVPMVQKALDPFYDDLILSRSTTKKSIELIIADLNFAIDWLPAKSSEGRITSAAASAFKGRVLLAWASPMFNPNNETSRWDDAYKANFDAKGLLDENGYGLNADYSKIFTDNPTINPEAIFYRAFSADLEEYSNGWEGNIRPTSGGGGGGEVPTWDLVKAFPMANGKSIGDASSGYDSVYYWRNRDPRFYNVIAYNGCTWDMAGRISSSNKVWTYTQAISENRKSPGTGFYNRKASNPLVDYASVNNVSTTWIEIRYAEVLLNLAECANEIGKVGDALDLVGEIRERAGIESMENYGLSSVSDISIMREIIMQERQVELCFENKRYWDLRRRKMFTEDLGPNVKKLNGSKRKGLLIKPTVEWARRVTSGDYRGWTKLDTAIFFNHVDLEADYNKYFDVSEKDLDVLNRFGGDATFAYRPLYYFMYISRSFINKAPSIEQTLGWQGGTFDPQAE